MSDNNENNSSYPTEIVMNKSLGIEIPVRVPSTIEGFLALPGVSWADLKNAILRHAFYQKWNNKFRKTMCEVLAGKTGVERRAKTNSAGVKIEKKNRKGEMVAELEQEQTYLDFLVDEGHISKEDFIQTGLEVGAGIPFEVSKAEEEKTPQKKFMDGAAMILAMAENGQSGSDGQPVTPEGFVQKWAAKNPSYNFEALGGWTQLGIARAIEINANREIASGGGLV